MKQLEGGRKTELEKDQGHQAQSGEMTREVEWITPSLTTQIQQERRSPEDRRKAPKVRMVGKLGSVNMSPFHMAAQLSSAISAPSFSVKVNVSCRC